MEGSTNVKSRKNESRSLLKKCFKNHIFSFVPYEIWKMIVNEVDVRSITNLSQTCWGFKELIDDVDENNYVLAVSLRKEGQIDLALKFLEKCAINGNSRASFHLGYAYACGGWGLEVDHQKAPLWFKKSAQAGNGSGMAWFAYYLKYVGHVDESSSADLWFEKALKSNDFFAIGCCRAWRISEEMDCYDRAFHIFEVSAKQGCEYSQNWYGQLLLQEESSLDEAFSWQRKSAEQGLSMGQYYLGYMYRSGQGCAKSNENAISWLKKAAKQKVQAAERVLEHINTN